MTADNAMPSDPPVIAGPAAAPRLETALLGTTEGCALLALEIDQFALIVHLHGVEAAEVIARHLVASTSEPSRSAAPLRMAPGQFAVAVPEGLAAAERLARTVRQAFRRTSWPDLGDVTLSAGVAQRYAREPVASWWNRVESALAQARGGGGDHVIVDRRRGDADAGATAPGLHLRWQARFECGDPTIDREHRELFERSEELLESLRQGSDRVAAELDRLIADIGRHFADEEAILERLAFPGLAGHRRSHADLTARALRMQAAVAAGQATREDLTRFLLGEVVADHMLTEDRRFASLFLGAR